MFTRDGARPRYEVSAGELAIGTREVRFGRLPAGTSGAVSLALFGFLPAFLTVRLFFQHGFGWDFRSFYDGARAYLDGESPYPRDSLAALADKQQFVYPAPTALLFVPLALLPYPAALSLWVVVSVGAIALALRVLGARDWRCFGALMLTLPAEHSLRLGTLGPLLLLLVALLWRYRDRVVVAAVLAAVVAVSKVFLTPLLLWLVFTRRARTAALAASLAVVMCLLAWLPLGESTIVSYPSLLRTLSGYEQTFSYSLTSLFIATGLSAGTAIGLAWTAGVLLLSLAYAKRSDDELVFRLALGACFLVSPIVWGHYFLLLAAPLALRWPRLSPVWLLAIWVRSDTLAIDHVSLLIALALVVMTSQLGLISPTRGWSLLGSARTRPLLVLAAVAGLQLLSLSSREAGYTRTAALSPITGSRAASGAASLRIDRPDRRLCWRIWTQALPSRSALVAIEPRVATGEQVVLRTRIDHAEALGCVVLPGADGRLMRRLISGPTGYRVLVAIPGRGVIAGSLSGA